MTRRFMLVVVLALMTSVAAAPARATARDGLRISPEVPTHERTYPPLLSEAPNEGTATVNWRSCAQQNVTFCDLIRLDVNPSRSLTKYTVHVTLSWPDPARNDLTLAVWDNPDDAVHICCRQADTLDSKAHPEHLEVDSAKNSTEPLTVWIIVDNFSGTNRGYTLKAEMRATQTVATPTPVPAVRPRTTTPVPPVPRVTSPTFVGTEPVQTPSGPTLRPGPVPGPDGALVVQTLPVVASGNRVPAAPRGASPVLVGMLSSLGTAAASWLLFVVWRRRQAEDELRA